MPNTSAHGRATAEARVLAGAAGFMHGWSWLRSLCLVIVGLAGLRGFRDGQRCMHI